MIDKYDEDYFVRGIETGKSLYSHYRWIPELTIPLAYNIQNNLCISHEDKILDFGCAMGYLVKAFRLLGFNAYGYDISEYALDNVPVDIQPYIYHGEAWKTKRWDWIICKDVLEHIPYNHIGPVLKELRSCSDNIFVVVPIASNGSMRYNEPRYELDATHIIRESIVWWGNMFQGNLLEVTWSSNEMKGVKENWKPGSNAFFKLKTNIL